ncbi:MAG: ribosome maturation factor RimM [Bacteroidota bacterium]
MANATEPQGFYTLGRLLRPHGIRGEFKAYFDVQHLEDYLGLDVVFVQAGPRQAPTKHSVTNVRHDKGQVVILELETVTSRDQAEALSKRELYLPEDFLPELDETTFYYHEVPGLTVVDTKLGTIGKAIDVVEQPAQDLLRVKHAETGKEVLIPMTEAFVPRIDREAGQLFTNLPDGLLEVYLTEDKPKAPRRRKR